MKTPLGALLLAGTLFLVAGAARASEFDSAMQPVVSQYLEIQRALAADRTDAVRESVEQIEHAAQGLDPKATAGDHAEHFKDIPRDLLSGCRALKAAGDIAATREAFKSLSRPIAIWVGWTKPAELSVMYCAMADAVWVQRGTEVANPYYGAEMATCGQKVGGAD